MLTLAGELPASSGEIHLHGKLTKAPLHVRARQHLSFVPEERSVFRGLSTRDNLRVGSCDMDYALNLFPELEKRINVRAGLLSGGEQQMLTLARALGRKPKVLLADELSLGLAPLIVLRLLEAVRSAANEQQTGVVLVEQHVRKVLKFADRVYVMRRGRIVLEGEAADLINRISDIEDQYLSSTSAA
ncbi:MAG: ATP-binding cassette domain-containing protein, partial [Actinobacteria bacterium]|nr:ATP-binding cassette domain-containing protein [Actinomycetota bacterium]